MPRKIALLLFLTPLIAAAECGFTRSGNVMTIVVGKNAQNCLASEGFRQAFKEDVAQALAQEEIELARQKKAYDDRNSRGRKLWNMAEQQHQASLATARYYGQRR